MKRRKRVTKYAMAIVDGHGVLLLHPLSLVVLDGIACVRDATGETVPESAVRIWSLTAEQVIGGYYDE